MSGKAYSLVVPTFNERENIDPLLSELQRVAVSSRSAFKIIVVDDDSPDGTAEYVKSVEMPNIGISCIHRIGRRGLGSAVIEGVMLADTEYVVVMDGDGQHSADDVIRLIAEAELGQKDLVVGSRFATKARLDNHIGFRAWLSAMGNKGSSMLIGRPVTDALTGFFVVRRSLFVRLAPRLSGHGFKILLDILFQVRKEEIKYSEVEITFGDRMHGTSKLEAAVLFDFVDQILLMFSRNIIPKGLFLFAIIGASGIIVNLSVLWMTLFLFNASFFSAQVLGTLISMLSNFHLNNSITFRRNRKRGKSYFSSLLKFSLGCSVGIVANVGVANHLFSDSHRSWWLASLAGVIVGTFFNYAIARLVVWKK